MGTPYRLVALAKERGISVAELIDDALRRSPSKTAAARFLRVGRATLYREIGRQSLHIVMAVGGKNDN